VEMIVEIAFAVVPSVLGIGAAGLIGSSAIRTAKDVMNSISVLHVIARVERFRPSKGPDRTPPPCGGGGGRGNPPLAPPSEKKQKQQTQSEDEGDGRGGGSGSTSPKIDGIPFDEYIKRKHAPLGRKIRFGK